MRTGWSLKVGDIVRRHEYRGTYTVLAVFRGYYGGEMMAKIRDQWGKDATVPAGSVFTLDG